RLARQKQKNAHFNVENERFFVWLEADGRTTQRVEGFDQLANRICATLCGWFCRSCLFGARGITATAYAQVCNGLPCREFGIVEIIACLDQSLWQGTWFGNRD